MKLPETSLPSFFRSSIEPSQASSPNSSFNQGLRSFTESVSESVVSTSSSGVFGAFVVELRRVAMSHPEESAQAHPNVKSEQVAPAQQATASCRKKKSESTSFFGDVVDHIDEFVNASYDEHKTCLQKTLNKMFGMSKAVSNGTGTTSATGPVENVMSRPATTE